MTNQVDLRELAVDRGGGAKPVRPRRRLVTRYLLPLALLVGFLWLVGWAARDVVFPPKHVTVVPVLSTTSEIRRGGVPLFKAAGWIEPRPTPVRVAALSPGVVEDLLVVEDQLLKAGEPVAELVKDDANLAHQKAKANLDLREAELDEARAELTAAETRLKQPVHLQAALSEADASLAKIETELKRLPFETRRADSSLKALEADYASKLAAKGVVSGVDVDIAKSKAEAAAALLEELQDRSGSLKKEQAALRRRRDALRTQLELRADELKARDAAIAKVRAATARVAQAGVVVAEAKLRFDRMTVLSPIDGRVFQLVAHPGARLAAGMGHTGSHDGSTVVTMYRPEMLQVRVDVRFEDIPKISMHQPVRIENPVLSSPLHGKVLFISSKADIQKNTLEVKVEIPEPPAAFKPEMLVDVTFLATDGPSSTSGSSERLKLFVLQQLIHEDDDGPFVWLADQSDRVARKTPVQTGVVGSNGLVEITGGLNLSSRVISGGSESLKDGDAIRITSEDASIGTRDIRAAQPPEK